MIQDQINSGIIPFADFAPHADPHIDTTSSLQKLPKANGKEKQWSLYQA
jgi:hypothetical protein